MGLRQVWQDLGEGNTSSGKKLSRNREDTCLPDHLPPTPVHLPSTPDHLPSSPVHLPPTPDHLPPDHLPPDHLPLTTVHPGPLLFPVPPPPGPQLPPSLPASHCSRCLTTGRRNKICHSIIIFLEPYISTHPEISSHLSTLPLSHP